MTHPSSRLWPGIPIGRRASFLRSTLLTAMVLLTAACGSAQGDATVQTTGAASTAAGASPFTLSLEPLNAGGSFAGLPGIQSFASGQHNGQWLIVGGRLDGLHRRQPWASFDAPGHNTRVYVVDPQTAEVWSAGLSGLTPVQADQFSSTNINATQVDTVLYLVGGYGYSPSLDEHRTHPLITAINLPGFIEAVRNGTPLAPHLRSLEDEGMAVTGGQMAERDGTFYLAGGQRFDGLYNPMGHPTHTQTYVNGIRRFALTDDGSSLALNWKTEWSDTLMLHRRDYNMAPAIFPDGSQGWTMFTGVFQYGVDLPWLTVVDLTADGFTERPGFTQYLSHYHSAHAALHSAADGAMHSVFFGGIAEYTMDPAGNLIQDTDVPFVRTISRVSQDASGTGEYALPVQMPGYLGSGAAFFADPALAESTRNILDLDALRAAIPPGDSMRLGWIYGGIASTAPNVFWLDNDGSMSAATANVYAVWCKPHAGTTAIDHTDQFNAASTQPLRLQVYPNPAPDSNRGYFRAAFELPAAAPVRIRAFSPTGERVAELELGTLPAGPQDVEVRFPDIARPELFILELEAGAEHAVQVVVSAP